MKPLKTKAPVLENQLFAFSNINREASAARHSVLQAGFPKLTPAGNDNDLAQCYQRHVVTLIAKPLNFDFVVIHMMEGDDQGTATWTASHSGIIDSVE